MPALVELTKVGEEGFDTSKVTNELFVLLAT